LLLRNVRFGSPLSRTPLVTNMQLASPLAVVPPATARLRVAGASRVRAVGWAALLVLTVIVQACGGDDSGWGRGFGGGGRKRIGVSLASRALPFYQAIEAGMRDAARRARYELVVVDANLDPAAQRTQVEGLLQQRVDAIVVAPIDTLAIVPAIQRANGARIPVFSVNLAPSGGRIVSHVQSDHVGMGRVAAEYLAAFLGDRGEVAIVSRAGVPWLMEREQGFRAALRAHRGIRIVDTVDAGSNRARALELIEPMLRARRETDGIFAVDDASALGAYDAAMARFRADLLIVGADPSDETLQLIRNEGPFKAALVQQPRRMGEQLIQLAVRHFDDEPVAPRVLVPVRLVNVDSLRAAPQPAPARR
jgi:ribose transport system substrate-binding protein